jgi:hypothetical protein
MNNQQPITSLDESSPSVQTHLGILQGVIQRMATNSASSKAWCITLVSAILVIVADKEKSELTLLALIPTFLFATLDVYYLALEKGFRNRYDNFINKLHEGTLAPGDLFSVSPSGNMSKLQFEAIKSFSVWGFYITLALMVFMTKYVVN